MPTQAESFNDISKVDPTSLVVDTLLDEADGSVTDGDVSLRDALAAIATGGTITFNDHLANENIILSLGELVVAKSLTIDGEDNNITIDAAQNSRVFNVDDGDDTNYQTVILDGLTITGGKVPRRGGGISSLENLEIYNSTIINNSASEEIVEGGTVSGGGIYSRKSRLTVHNSTIADNSVRGFEEAEGGGISSSGILTVSNSTISGNHVDGGFVGIGGGISSFGTLTVSNSTISSNHADAGYRAEGGGVYSGSISGGGILTVNNSTISSNHADGVNVGFGGGIFSFASTSKVANSTITGNSVSGSFESGGSGIVGVGQAEVGSSIIAKNAEDNDISGSFISQGHNLIGNGDGGSGFTNGINGDIVGTTFNTIDPRIGPLTDNGGSTMTHALLSGSPAIDAGDADFMSPPAFDQRGEGFPRVIDGNGDSKAVIDIGAFESPERDSNAFFFSGDSDRTVGNITFSDEDIVLFNGSDFSIVFDGSDVLPRNAEISAFDVVNDTMILMSFRRPLTIKGLGHVDDSDIVTFTPSSKLGERQTKGTFELYLDGSDVGLTRHREDIDALTQMPDGSLLLSTTGSVSVPGVFAQDEDLLRFQPKSLGKRTRGSFSLYFDGSDVGLNRRSEDINAIGMRQNELLLSSIGNVSVSGVSARNEDIFSFTPATTGANTTGSFGSELFFDGNQFSFTGILTGVDLNIG